MTRMLLSYFGYRRVWWMGRLVILVAVTFTGIRLGLPPAEAGCRALLLVLLLSLRTCVMLCRLGWRTRSFLSASSKEVELRYARELLCSFDVAEHLACWESARAELEEQFGFRLRRRLVVFLFARGADLGPLCGSALGAAAWVGGDAVSVAADHWSMRVPGEVARHEVAHLLAGCTGRPSSPFWSEGLAVWLQGSHHGRSVDAGAAIILWASVCPPLPLLLEPKRFGAYGDDAYVVAGSFTGFLIRRYGWPTYLRFYRSHGLVETEVFRRAFGVGILTAAREWRDDLDARRSELLAGARRALHEQSLGGFYSSWQLHRCLALGKDVLEKWPDSRTALSAMAFAQRIHGHWEEAADLLERWLDASPADSLLYRARIWRALGEVRDLLGQREAAIAAYRQCLAQPDGWSEQDGSEHRIGRYRLRVPFTDADEITSLEREGKRRRRR